jgi:peptidoglycan/xylan/chitin deacetylase (PgdA/CDA1 family)
MRAVLTYHSLDDSGSPISVSADAFRRHLDWLARENVAIVPLDQLLDLDDGRHAAAITFDDGFDNVATAAVPLTSERGISITLFVVTDRVGTDNAWSGRAAPGIPTLPLLDWAGLARLRERGVVLGSHTKTHPRLTTLDDDGIREEVEGSVDRIERETGTRPTAFAYPYGSLNHRVRSAVARSCAVAVTTEHRPLGPADDRHEVPRLDMYYFRDPAPLPAWNGLALRRRIWFRRQARRARAWLASVQ